MSVREISQLPQSGDFLFCALFVRLFGGNATDDTVSERRPRAPKLSQNFIYSSSQAVSWFAAPPVPRTLPKSWGRVRSPPYIARLERARRPCTQLPRPASSRRTGIGEWRTRILFGAAGNIQIEHPNRGRRLNFPLLSHIHARPVSRR